MSTCMVLLVFVNTERGKTAKRDSGGIVVYFKEDVVKGVQEIRWNYDDGICLKFDKFVFGWERDIYLLCVYMGSNTSTREGVNIDMNCYDMLEEQLSVMSKKGG